jgi:hypothetical protein
MTNILTLLLCILGLSTSNAFAYGNTHTVHSYERSDGTYVEQHEAGNPGSGVHCHDNVCN